MKSIQKFFYLILFVVAASPSIAQQQKGDKIVNFNAGYTQYGSADGTFNMNLQIGKFIGKHFEVGYQPGFFIAKTFSQFNQNLYATFNFLSKRGRFLPYIGVNVGYTSVTADQTTYDPRTFQTSTESVTTSNPNVGGKVGFRTYFSEHGFYDFGVNFLQSGDNQIVLANFGLGYIFRKKKAE